MPAVRHRAALYARPAWASRHFAQATGPRACQRGHSVLRTPTHRVLNELRASRADGTYERRLQRFVSPDLLVVGDVGLHPLAQDEPVDLYELIRQRYERAATILNSNRALPEGAQLFRDDLLASAALDRLSCTTHTSS